jgi:transcriptional regulator with XRE-family HTH domain
MESSPFIEALVRIMKERRWNQQQLAEEVGVGKSTVTYWMQGGLPEERQLARLCELAGADAIDAESITFARMYRNFKCQLRRRKIDPAKYNLL